MLTVNLLVGPFQTSTTAGVTDRHHFSLLMVVGLKCWVDRFVPVRMPCLVTVPSSYEFLWPVPS
jgi:hypothetical protein